VNYHVDPLPESKIRELIAKTGGSAHDVLRKKEPIYKELRLDQREVSDDELMKLMAEHPQLLQRPIVERGNRAVLARPVERALDLLEGV
jgi:arsenate reductase